MANNLILVEFDLYDGSSLITIRLSNITYVTFRGAVKYQYDPRLITPIQLGTKISAEQYGQAIRGAPNGGVIEFVLSEEMYFWLDYHWIGREFRVYQGDENDLDFSHLMLRCRGRVSDLTFETTIPKVSVKTTDFSLDFNKPLIDVFYEDLTLDTDTGEPLITDLGDALVSAQEILILAGLPKPRLWGQAFGLEPILEDVLNQVFRISTTKLYSVDEVRVGGVVWTKISGRIPGDGEWTEDLDAGTITLGSSTLNGEVRCDAKAVGWDVLTSGEFIKQIAEHNGNEIDATSFSEFNSLVPGLIGFYTHTDPINIQDVFDQVMLGAGGWWESNEQGKVRIGVIAAPSGSADKEFGEIDISDLKLNSRVPPAWRIRIEYRRNWQPMTTFFTGVSNLAQKEQRATGIITSGFKDENIKITEPQAVDVPLIRSLFVSLSDADGVRDRLAEAWRITRKLYDLVVFADVDELYSVVSVDYLMLNSQFRVHSQIVSINGETNSTSLQVWG